MAKVSQQKDYHEVWSPNGNKYCLVFVWLMYVMHASIYVCIYFSHVSKKMLLRLSLGKEAKNMSTGIPNVVMYVIAQRVYMIKYTEAH